VSTPRPRSFTGKLTHSLVQTLQHALDAEVISARDGFLQRLDPRIKLLGLLALIVSTVLAKTLLALGALFVLAVGLALGSQIGLARLAKQLWLGVLLFTGVIALPALVLVPGTPLAQLPGLPWPVTLQGLRSAAFLIGRAETSATFALLLILSTPWPHVLKAMRSLGVPVVLVAVLGMTHRYIFVLLTTATQMFEARRSRLVAPVGGAAQRRLVAAAAGVLLGKSFELSAEVHQAMISRGYRGEIHLLDQFHTHRRDWLALGAALAIPILILWYQV
jgi:cobalt/nickel transport system permease protein